MTEGTQEASDFVRAQLEKLKASRALYFAAKETMIDVSERVWGQGALTDGTKITYKEDYELWAYTPPSPRKVTGRGKPFDLWERSAEVATSVSELRASTSRARSARAARSKAPKNAKERKIKGGWYKSYLSYKQQQGREDLPFELTGRLRKAYFSGVDNPTSLKEVSDRESFIFLTGDNAGKYIGLTDTKGDFLALNEFEQEAYRQRIINLLAE
jgi:hypothetical protein